MPKEIQAILDGCAVFDTGTGEWVGNLRDRLLFALLAESGLFSGGSRVTRALKPSVCAVQRLMERL